MGLEDFAERASLHRSAQFRNFDLSGVECRDAADGSGFTFEGVASVVDVPYTVNDQFGSFQETIRSGAFNKTLKDKTADVALYINHRHADVPMASTRAGTMKLSADPNLRAIANLDPLRSDVVIARSAVLRGELPQMSVGFTVPKDTSKDVWNADYTERVIHEINLMEVSIVRQGANPHTEAAMRSIDDLLNADTTARSPDEIRRALAYLEGLLPEEVRAVEIEEIINEFAERDRADRERLERKRLNRPSLV